MTIDLEKYVQQAVTVCDNCGYEFSTSKTIIESKTICHDGEELTMQYFRCFRCDSVYVIGFENAETLKALQALQEARSNMERAYKQQKSEKALKRLLKASKRAYEMRRRVYNPLQERLVLLRGSVKTIGDVRALQ